MAQAPIPALLHHQSQRGFSLLEMMVAIAILGIALGVLYQAVGGASRIVQTGERYAYAVAIAESLLADNAVVPANGLEISGETGGDYLWEVRAAPLPNEAEPPLARLLMINIIVSWGDANTGRYDLTSIVAGAAEQ